MTATCSTADLIELGLDAAERGDERTAEAALQAALDLSPADEAALFPLVELLVGQGRLQEAAARLSRALGTRPQAVEILTVLGLLAPALGDPELAVACFEAAAAAAPGDPEPLQRLADAELALGHDEATSAALRRLEEVQPTRLSSLLIEITTHCNLKCPGCLRTIRSDEGTWHNRHLSVAEFQAIVDGAPPADELIPQGVGEPTLHPDLPELIRYARHSGKFGSIAFTTNALTRDIDYFGRLFEAGLSYLNVSVDSLDPTLAAELRTGTVAAKLRERARQLAERFPVVIFVTVGRRNREHLPDLLAELAELRPWRVNLHPFDDMGRPEQVLSCAEKAELSADFPALAARFPTLTCELHGFGPASGACPVLWDSPAVTVDGALTPCCRILDSQVFSFGDVIAQPLTQVWRSVGRARWMQEFRQRRPEVCRGCAWYPEPEAV